MQKLSPHQQINTRVKFRHDIQAQMLKQYSVNLCIAFMSTMAKAKTVTLVRVNLRTAVRVWNGPLDIAIGKLLGTAFSCLLNRG